MTRSRKLPAMQFYPGDWRKDVAVQSLSYHDRGVWHELICFMWEADDRGVLAINGNPMTEEEIARMLGMEQQTCSKTLANLRAKGVFSVRSDGAIYSRRMVRDEDISVKRAIAGAEGGKASKTQAKGAAKPEQNTEDEDEDEDLRSKSKKNSPPVEHWNFTGAMDRAELREWAPKVREKLWRVGRTFGQFELEAALSNHGLEAVVAALRHTCQLTEPRNLCYPGDRNGSGGGKRKSKLDLELDEIRNA